MTETFPVIVYALCFLTSAACALLLGRSYQLSGARLLLWSCACFVFLALNNLVLILDLVTWPDMDLRLVRVSLSLAAVSSLIWGVLWEVEREGP
jgi:hypothetical protein